MKTVDKNIINEIVINKSRFICELIKIDNNDDIKLIINNVKLKYKDATHYCYAYITNNVKRFNDDGEPGGTAGMPILNVLESNELSNVICIVIRYFGGIKLGAGGLVRAYTKACTEALSKVTIKDLIENYKVELSFNYDNSKMIDYILNDIDIINKEFNDYITYTLYIPVIGFDKLKSSLDRICLHISIIDKLYI